MKVVILAGGMGTRLQEETVARPKPMVEIGGKPILLHIMKHYAHYGFDDFYVALGYLGDFIKGYFLDCYNHSGNLTIDFARRSVQRSDVEHERWRVNLVDTGAKTMTGGRVQRLRRHLFDSTFMLTYGDGVSNVDLQALLDFHRSHGKLATVTAVRPPARFGGLVIKDGSVEEFTEKPLSGEGWINGGFMVLEPGIFEYLTGDECVLEVDLLQRLSREGELAAWCHPDFWQCMDTIREKNYLEKLWAEGTAPWRVWDSPVSVKLESRKAA
ncbi:MAG: glucose-1-phosphate cytidylyltransferase [Planctomycetaceae bacterium]|nr:glucose-1-phosphate cytidylyltransferase [Planctomycetaceae bacterium]